MVITNKILKVWKPVIKDLGYTVVAKGSKINYRTLKRAIENRTCKDPIFDKIQEFMAERQLVVKMKTEPQEQD